MTSLALERPRRVSLFSGEIPRVALAVAAALIVLRIAIAGIGLPLWLDETFSATIAVQPTARGLLDWCLNELSGPLYYSTLWAWEKLAGDSNVALRIPGQVVALATPLFLLWKGHPDRRVRVMWALTIGLWPFGFDFYITARPYAMVVLLGCVQAACYLRLMEAPTTRRAAIWAGASALAILTHYHAIVISVVEGVFYIATWRGTALRTWRATSVLVPLVAWMSFHLAMVLRYAASGQTWYQLVGWVDVVVVVLVLLGGFAMTLLVLVLVPVAVVQAHRRGEPVVRWTPETAVISAALVATVIVVTAGALRPTFAVRYLLADLGAVSLFVPLLLRAVRPTMPMAPLVAVLLMIGAAASPLVHKLTDKDSPHRYAFNYEQASDWITRQGGTRRVVFLWDNPIVLRAHPDKLAEVGGFFFKRAGHPVEVLIPRYPLKADPWPSVRALAAGRADTAVIWMADKDVPMTSMLTHPIGIGRDPTHWNCHDFGGGQFTVLACVPRSAGPAASAPRT